MKQQILQTPEGVRDIYGIDYSKKSIVEDKLQNVFRMFGYQYIQPSIIECLEVFGKEIGSVSSRELFKFFDRDGNALVLRPDFTPSIARAASTIYDTEHLPIRLCYKGNTFIDHSDDYKRMRETTQYGAELIGNDSVEADAEMIAMAVECLKSAGLHDFQVHIGCVEFLEYLIREANLSVEIETRLRHLIKDKSYHAVSDLLEKEQEKVTVKAAFQVLPELTGGIEILKEAKKIALNTQILDVVKRMEELYKLLEAYEVNENVIIDLSLCGTREYYTGIIFQVHTDGKQTAVIKGGRYDKLMEKFGKPSSAIGFVCIIDELMNTIARQKIEIPIQYTKACVMYDKERESEAIRLVKDFRSKGKETELIIRREDVSVEDYMNAAKNNLCVIIMYLKKSKEIEMINLLNGKRKSITKTIK